MSFRELVAIISEQFSIRPMNISNVRQCRILNLIRSISRGKIEIRRIRKPFADEKRTELCLKSARDNKLRRNASVKILE